MVFFGYVDCCVSVLLFIFSVMLGGGMYRFCMVILLLGSVGICGVWLVLLLGRKLRLISSSCLWLDSCIGV